MPTGNVLPCPCRSHKCRIPVRVPASSRVFVLVDMHCHQNAPGRVRHWEVGRHPVDDDADTILVALVHEEFEIIRCCHNGWWEKTIRRADTPRAVKRVFADRQYFYVGVAHGLDVGNQNWPPAPGSSVGDRALPAFWPRIPGVPHKCSWGFLRLTRA